MAAVLWRRGRGCRGGHHLFLGDAWATSVRHRRGHVSQWVPLTACIAIVTLGYGFGALGRRDAPGGAFHRGPANPDCDPFGQFAHRAGGSLPINEEFTTNAGTGDPALMIKGSAICGGLLSLSAGAFWGSRGLGSFRSRHHRWSLRRCTLWALLVGGVAALEMLRISEHLRFPFLPRFHPIWEEPIASVLSRNEPGWPYALSLWLWLDVTMVLTMFDNRIITYLLHRTGYTWAPKRLSMQETYLVDALLVALASHHVSRTSSASRRSRPCERCPPPKNKGGRRKEEGRRKKEEGQGMRDER